MVGVQDIGGTPAAYLTAYLTWFYQLVHTVLRLMYAVLCTHCVL